MNSVSEKMPAYVAIFFSDYVRIHGDVTKLWPKLKVAGYKDKLFIDKNNYWAIRFEPGNPLSKNISLLTLLFLLNDLNVPFAKDFKDICSPATFMSQLQRDLILKKSFRSVSEQYKEYKDWNYETHEPLVSENLIVK